VGETGSFRQSQSPRHPSPLESFGLACLSWPLMKIFITALLCLLASTLWAEAPQELRIGYFPNITHAQALYARATGAYERDIGVPIKWSSFNAGPTAIEALFAGAIDVAYIGPSPTINGYAKSEGTIFSIVAGAASGGAGLVIRKDSGLATPADFSGKTVATPQLGNTQDIAARVWLLAHGLKLKERGGDVAVVPLSNPDQLLMMNQKQIDAAWTVEPWLSRLETEGVGTLLIDEGTLWPQGKYVTTHLIVSKKLIETAPQLLQKLLRAHVEVTQKLNSDRQVITQILNEQLKKETTKSLSAEVITRALQRIEFTWDPIASSLKKNAEDATKIGYLKKTPDLSGIYNLATLNQILTEKNLALVHE
jgi:NitT/TauT family transport system substrate-binding protein